MKCKHRGYQAKRRPRVNCEACWRKYIEKHPVEPESTIEEDSFWLTPPNKERFSWLPSPFEWW